MNSQSWETESGEVYSECLNCHEDFKGSELLCKLCQDQSLTLDKAWVEPFRFSMTAEELVTLPGSTLTLEEAKELLRKTGELERNPE